MIPGHQQTGQVNQVYTSSIPQDKAGQSRFDADISQASAFLDALSNGTPVTFQTFDDTPAKRPDLPKILHGPLEDVSEHLTWLNQQGAGIFVMVNEGDGKGRTANNVVRVRALFVDTDGAPYPGNLPLNPHIVVESSPEKWHLYWLVDGLPLGEFSALQKNLAKIYGTDPLVNDLPRVMRLPGFFHCKNEPVMTQLLEVHDHAPYTFAEIQAAFPLPPKKEKKPAPLEEITGQGNRPSTCRIVEHMLGNFNVDDGRNNYGFKIACQIRDNGYSQDECINAMLQHYLPAVEDVSDLLYTEGEMLASIQQAYKQEARKHWTRREGKTYPLTDAGNAERLVDEFGGKFCYVKGLGWLVYDSKRWVQDDSAVMRYALQTIRGLHRGAAAIHEKLSADNNERETLLKQIDALRKHVKTCESESRLKSMVSLARHVEGVTVDLDMFDRQDDLLNVANGTIDLKTGVLREHRAEDFITQMTDVFYDPAATCQKWEEFQQQISTVNGAPDPEMVAYKKKLWGYTLTGDTSEQKMMVAYGNGSNGKSTELEVIRHILGDYAKTTAFTTFLERRDGTATNDIAALRGARFVYASEGDVGAKLSESLVKTITGDGTISARHLYQEYFTFRPHCKIWLATNHLPTITGQNNGIWRRLLPLDYAAVFSGAAKTKNMDAVLKAEAVGVLAWMVRGAVAWYRQGLEPLPKRVERNHGEYKSSMDVLGEFIEDCFELEDDTTLDKKDFQEAFNEWGKIYNYRLSPKALTQVMAEKNHKLQKSGARRYYVGLKLKKTSDASTGPPDVNNW